MGRELQLFLFSHGVLPRALIAQGVRTSLVSRPSLSLQNSELYLHLGLELGLLSFFTCGVKSSLGLILCMWGSGSCYYHGTESLQCGCACVCHLCTCLSMTRPVMIMVVGSESVFLQVK